MASDDRLHERVLEFAAGELLLLIGVGQVAHLDQHRRHVGRLEHANGARSTAGRPSGTRSLKLLLEDARRTRSIDRDGESAPGPTARARCRAGRRRTSAPRSGASVALAPARSRRRRRHRIDAPVAAVAQRGVGVQADEEIRLVVVGDRGPLVERHARSSSRVSSTRTPSRPSMAALMRRATASVRSFSFVPLGALDAPSSPPWPGSIAIVRIADDRLSRRRRQVGGRRPRAAARRRPSSSSGADADRSPAAWCPRWSRLMDANPAKRGPRSIASVDASTTRIAWTRPCG